VIKRLAGLNVDTERLVIRVAEKDDLKSIYSIHIDDEVNRYLPYDTWLSWDDALKWYQRVEDRRALGDAEQFIIVRKRDQQIVGTCIVFDFDSDDQSCEFGYVLNRQYWNRGYMLEATQEFVQSLMSQAEINSIRAVVQANNTASLKLLQKLSFEVIYTEPAEDNSKSAVYLRLGG